MVALRFYMNHISSVPVLPKRLMILERCHFTLMMVYCPLESSLENQAVFLRFSTVAVLSCSNSHRQYVSCWLYLRVSFTTPQGATKLAVTLPRHFEETSQKPALLHDMVGKIQLP